MGLHMKAVCMINLRVFNNITQKGKKTVSTLCKARSEEFTAVNKSKGSKEKENK